MSRNDVLNNYTIYFQTQYILYPFYIPLSMTVAMEDFLLLVGVGVVYLVALLAYNKFGKTKEE